MDSKNDVNDVEAKGTIKFKQTNGKRKKVKGILFLTIVIVLAVISGALSADLIINFKFNDLNRKTSLPVKDKNNLVYINNQITKVINKVSSSVVTIANSEDNINNKKDCVSGFVFKSDGYIATNFSSIKNFNHIFIKPSGVALKPFKAFLVGYDNDSDLAILKIDSNNLNVPDFADEDDVKVGDIVLALGNDISSNYIGLVTSGIITSTNKSIKNNKNNIKLIQTNAIINNENNGGILINVYGDIVGLNNLGFSKKFSTQGLNLALDINELEKTANSIIQFGRVKSVGMGLDCALVRESKNSSAEGIYIKAIDPNGSGAKAGLKPTDIILEIDNKKVKSSNDIINILDQKKVGDYVQCKVLRDGKIQNFKIKLLDDK